MCALPIATNSRVVVVKDLFIATSIQQGVEIIIFIGHPNPIVVIWIILTAGLGLNMGVFLLAFSTNWSHIRCDRRYVSVCSQFVITSVGGSQVTVLGVRNSFSRELFITLS